MQPQPAVRSVGPLQLRIIWLRAAVLEVALHHLEVILVHERTRLDRGDVV